MSSPSPAIHEYSGVAVSNTTNLTQYLTTALENADSEKKVLSRRLDSIEISDSHLVTMQKQLAEANGHVHRLQEELSTTKMVLQEEREKVMRLMNENHVLTCQAEEDRGKIQALLASRKMELAADPTAAVPSMHIHAKSAAASPGPAAHQSMSLSSYLVPTPHRADRNAASGPSRGGAPRGGGAYSPPIAVVNVAPTPNATVNALHKEIDGLKTLLDDQRRAYDGDRAQRIADEKNRTKKHEEVVAIYIQQTEHTRGMLAEVTRELCTFRHDAQIRERRLVSDLETAHQRLAVAQRALEEERERQDRDVREALAGATAAKDVLVERLRGEAAARDDDAAQLQHRYEETITMLTKQLEETRRKLSREKTKRETVERRAAVDKEGMESDLGLMRQQLRQFEKKLYFASVRDMKEQGVEVPPAASATRRPRPASARRRKA